MPRIPAYNTPLVAPEALPGFRQQPIPAGDGLLTAGKGLQGFGGALMEAARKEQEEANYYEVLEKTNEYNRVLEARKQQLGELQGKAADDAPNIARQWQEEERTKLRGTIKNERVLRAFDAKAIALETSYFGFAQAHRSREVAKYRQEVYRSSLDNDISAAASAPLEAGKIAEESRKKILAQAMVEGMSAEDPETQNRLRTQLTKLHIGVINALLAGDNANLAKEYFEAHDKEIDGTVKDDVLRTLKTSNDASLIQRDIATAMALGKTETETLAHVRKSVPPERMDHVANGIKTRFNEMAEAKREQDYAQLQPWNAILNQARAARKSIPQAQINAAVTSLNIYDPNLAERMINAMTDHNEALRPAKTGGGTSGGLTKAQQRDLNWQILKYDMQSNPDKWQGADLKAVLLPGMKSGELPVGVLDDARAIQDKIRTPEEKTTIITTMQHLESRLSGSKVGGKWFNDLDKVDQQQIKFQAAAAAEEALSALQTQLKRKPTNAEVRGAIDDLFTTQRFRDTFLGIRRGDAYHELDPAGADRRSAARKVGDIPLEIVNDIKARLQRKRLPVTPENILKAYEAKP